MMTRDHLAVVKHYVKATGQSHNQFLLLAEGVSMALAVPWDIINPVAPLDLKRQPWPILDYRQIATRVDDARQFYDVRSFHGLVDGIERRA